MIVNNIFAQIALQQRALNILLIQLGFSCFNSIDKGRHALERKHDFYLEMIQKGMSAKLTSVSNKSFFSVLRWLSGLQCFSFLCTV